jgi:hypothetical protein
MDRTSPVCTASRHARLPSAGAQRTCSRSTALVPRYHASAAMLLLLSLLGLSPNRLGLIVAAGGADATEEVRPAVAATA